MMRVVADFATHRVWDAGLRATLDDALTEIAQLSDGLRVRSPRHRDGALQALQPCS
ncbi:MAG: hypothetical protein U0163_10885 [Gemmatimonadaceae bacterium]